jgi:hypothetical protein
METWDLVIPYHEGKLQAQLQEFGSVNHTKYLEKGTFMQVKLDSGLARKLDVKRFATSKVEDANT